MCAVILHATYINNTMSKVYLRQIITSVEQNRLCIMWKSLSQQAEWSFFYFKRSKLPFIWHLIGFYFHKRRTFLKNTWRITFIILIAQVSRCNKTGDKNVSNNNTVFFLIYHCVKFIVTSIFVLSADSAERPMQHGNPLNEEFKNNFRNSLKPTTKKICRENNGSSSLHWLQLIEVTVFYFVCWLWYGSSFPLISTSV